MRTGTSQASQPGASCTVRIDALRPEQPGLEARPSSVERPVARMSVWSTVADVPGQLRRGEEPVGVRRAGDLHLGLLQARRKLRARPG